MDEDIKKQEEEEQETIDYEKNKDPLTNFMFGTNFPSNRRT
jgi:hypothetical protein